MPTEHLLGISRDLKDAQVPERQGLRRHLLEEDFKRQFPTIAPV